MRVVLGTWWPSSGMSLAPASPGRVSPAAMGGVRLLRRPPPSGCGRGSRIRKDEIIRDPASPTVEPPGVPPHLAEPPGVTLPASPCLPPSAP